MIISLPIFIQQTILLGLNIIDTIMISSLGENAITAVGLGYRIYFIFNVIIFGTYSGAAIFIAQYYGAGDKKSIKKVFSIDLVAGGFIAIIFTLLVFIFRANIIRLFINDDNVIILGSKYLRISSLSYCFFAISYAFNFNSRAIHKLKIPTIITASSLLINTSLNYILISGRFGFPALGVEGAATSMLISRIFEFVLMIAVIFKDKTHPLVIGISDLFNLDISLAKKIFKTSFPVLLSETAWSIGTSVYFIAFGLMGSFAIAVVQISFNVLDFFQAMFIGLGSCATVIIGNEIGKNDIDSALTISDKFLKITTILGAIFTVLLFAIRVNLSNLFKLEPLSHIYLEKLLIVFAIYFIPKMLSYMIIVGILRAGGDTKFCMLTDIFTIWFMGVPSAFVAVTILKLPVHLTIAIVYFEEVVKAIISYKRYKSKKWINNVIM